jgi:cobalt/nickel transport protein
MTLIKKFRIGLIVLIVLSPVGLILPDHFKAGAAWGEWGPEEMQELVGYIPQGLAKLAELWRAPLPDYAFHGWEEKGLLHLSFSYIGSAVVGIGVIVALMHFLGHVLVKEKD